MKGQRDVSGLEIAKELEIYSYEITRRTGSHIRLTTQQKGEHHITIPAHCEIKVGTLNSILKSAAEHLEISKKELLGNLFGYLLTIVQHTINKYNPRIHKGGKVTN